MTPVLSVESIGKSFGKRVILNSAGEPHVRILERPEGATQFKVLCGYHKNLEK